MVPQWRGFNKLDKAMRLHEINLFIFGVIFYHVEEMMGWK